MDEVRKNFDRVLCEMKKCYKFQQNDFSSYKSYRFFFGRNCKQDSFENRYLRFVNEKSEKYTKNLCKKRYVIVTLFNNATVSNNDAYFE